VPIALYDCVHGASGMPSDGQHALGTKYLRRKRRNAYIGFCLRWCLWGRQLAYRRVICQATPFRNTISPSAFLWSVPHFSGSRPTLFIPCGRFGVCAVSLARPSDDIMTKSGRPTRETPQAMAPARAGTVFRSAVLRHQSPRPLFPA